MIESQSIPQPEQPGIEAIAAGWQQLAREVRFLELRGIVIPLELSAQFRALAERSSEALRTIAAGEGAAGLALQQPGTARGIARRMLGAGSTETREISSFEGVGPAPGRGYQLLMTGTGALLPAQEIVRLIASRKLRGILKLRTTRETFTLEVDRGEIAQMHTNQPIEGERLGEILVRRGVLDLQQLDGIRARNRGKLGEILQLGKHVTQQQLLAALETQVHQLVGRLCQAQAENFSFWTGPLSSATPRLRVAISELMLVPFLDEGNDQPDTAQAPG